MSSEEVEACPDMWREIATEFYYWWHNQDGTNTQQGFDEWWRIEGQHRFAPETKPVNTPPDVLPERLRHIVSHHHERPLSREVTTHAQSQQQSKAESEKIRLFYSERTMPCTHCGKDVNIGQMMNDEQYRNAIKADAVQECIDAVVGLYPPDHVDMKAVNLLQAILNKYTGEKG